MSILVHTGSAYAGHYYAYLRDVSRPETTAAAHETSDVPDTWLQFNDAVVTRLDGDMLKYVLGLSNTAEPAGNSTVRCAGNAYMLVYRKVTPANINDVDDECIPSDLNAAIAEENSRYLDLKAKRDYERTFLNLQVMHNGTTKLIRIHESSTVSELTDTAYTAFYTQEEIQDAKSDENNSKIAVLNTTVPLTAPRACVRLRVYDSVKGVVLPASVFGGDVDKVLSTFPEAVLSKKFQFEIKSSTDEDFESSAGSLGGISFIIIPFKPNKTKNCAAGLAGEFLAPSQILVPVNSTLHDLYIVAARISYTQVFGERGFSSSHVPKTALVIVDGQTGVPTLLPDSDLSIVSQRILVDGSRLFCQLLDDGFSKLENAVGSRTDEVLGPSDVFNYFVCLKNMVTLNCTYPGEAGNTCSMQISVSASDTLGSLKDEIAKKMDIAQNVISLHKGKHIFTTRPKTLTQDNTSPVEVEVLDCGPGPEFKDLTIAIAAAGLEDGCDLEVCLGSPLESSHVRLAIFSEKVNESGISSINYMGSAIVSRDDTAHNLKEFIRGKYFVESEMEIRLRLGEVSLQQSLQSHCNIYLIEKYPMGHGYEVKMTNTVLPDSEKLSNSVKKLGDGSSIICQFGVSEKEFRVDDILLSIRYWNITQSIITTCGDLVVAKGASIQELKRIISTFLFTCNKTFFDRSNQDTLESDSILIMKAMNWQLNDLSAVTAMKWRSQPPQDAMISMQPLRLISGSIILCCSLNEFNASFPLQDDLALNRKHETADSDQSQNRPDARAFRVFSVLEQSVRRQEAGSNGLPTS
jgi:hypothetical protein